jgi:soluble lytic murein transglycosylase
MQRLREGISAAGAARWQEVRSSRTAASDPLVRRILTWRLAIHRESALSFSELDQALNELAGWPGQDTIRRKAEQAIIDSSLSAAERAAWLSQGGPISGDGKVYLAQALQQTGDRAGAARLLREAWRENNLTPRAEGVARQGFAGVLTSEDHAVRVDRALWNEDRGDAQRLLPLLSPDQRKLAEARIALQRPPRRGLQQIVERVPASLSDHPGLLHDRARYIRRDGRPDDAAPLVTRMRQANIPAYGRAEAFELSRVYVPSALRAGDGRRAYGLVANHGMTSGEAFAEAEWLAGWVALRYLRDPVLAEQHFARLGQGVSTPVSRARADYWRAQALKAAGREDEAAMALRAAAVHNFTYYGQLAAARSQADASLFFADPAAPTPQESAAFHSRELVRALRLLGEVGDQEDFEAMAFYLDDVLTSPVEHELLSQVAREKQFWRTAVRSAKAGIRRGIVAPQSAFPLMNLPSAATRPGRPEPALVLAIIRQESEFDPRARSRADARGLMQLLPRTARSTAQSEGMPFQVGWLMDDPSYNVTLGSAYLEDLLDDWGGSYVLTIASYNAGPGRARQWIDDWGDPRRSTADVVDWVELIPFSETRNYVQRVLENVQVYRHRLAGGPAPIRIEQDLRRGAR